MYVFDNSKSGFEIQSIGFKFCTTFILPVHKVKGVPVK